MHAHDALDFRLDLREAWADLLQRRAAFREALAVYGEIVEVWAAWAPPRRLGVVVSAEECRARWEQGRPLVELAARTLRAADVEDLVGGVMEALARAAPQLGPGLQRFAEAWDAGTVTPGTLLPERGRIGPVGAAQAGGLSADAVAFVVVAGLRPALEAMFAPVREHLDEGSWSLGVCPFCAGPPGFTDVIEDGRRRLACHLCGGGWGFAKLRCPFCGVDGAQHLVRLTPEEAKEEGYLVSACRECRAYLKEVDRRARWNAGPALVEDWGSPHFDLVAHQQGYWRPVPSIVQLVERI
ncbi:MAG TPA: formate dehydrogenase accessory protein FdhE [Methylomirabilota bacterium]|nr:formate dehydrogenase accessory protein FdhE [Methylomirabilota bacterium]